MLNNVRANILIVDDKENNIFALEQLLTSPERNFIRAGNGKEALKTALNNDVDLIILDVQMPGMDGFEVANILKSNKRTKDIPIIFASAEKKEHKFMLQGFEEGAVDYLYKPLDAEITEARVSVLLQLHLQKKELQRNNFALEKYALLINNSADLICIINARTLKFEEVNQAVNAILGYTIEEIKGNSILSYLFVGDRPEVQKICKEDKEKFSFETRVYTKEKEIKWLNWNIVNKNGLWFANARDITQHKKTDRKIMQLNADLKTNVTQLEEANKELESFSYSVSHDLRAPLRSIKAYSRKILEEHHTKLDEELNRLFGVIQNSADRMGTLIDDLLAFSKLGKKEVMKVSFDFNKMVHQAVKELEGPGESKAEISIQSLKSTEGDQSLLYLVFINLISNAIKYSRKRKEPVIEIGFSMNDEEYIYYVKDNGTGFDMNYSHKLFCVFQRLHSSREFEGTGAGLAIVKRIIVKHGGRVWAEGKLDEGATFYFSLPKPILENDKKVYSE